MAFLIVAGITVNVAEGGARLTTLEIGDRGRADDGTMRASTPARKRTWAVTTGIMTSTDAATLRAALIAAPTVTASGDWIAGGPLTVWPVLGDEAPGETVPYSVRMTFTLEEA